MSHRLQVLIPETLDAQLRKAAQRNRISKGEWVRRALEKSVAPATRPISNALDRLSSLNAPTCDMDQMLAEIEAGRR
jgi:hypothetical protein